MVLLLRLLILRVPNLKTMCILSMYAMLLMQLSSSIYNQILLVFLVMLHNRCFLLLSLSCTTLLRHMVCLNSSRILLLSKGLIFLFRTRSLLLSRGLLGPLRIQFLLLSRGMLFPLRICPSRTLLLLSKGVIYCHNLRMMLVTPSTPHVISYNKFYNSGKLKCKTSNIRVKGSHSLKLVVLKILSLKSRLKHDRSKRFSKTTT